jgi:imidazolonepropionase-like amidohydrolase
MGMHKPMQHEPAGGMPIRDGVIASAVSTAITALAFAGLVGDATASEAQEKPQTLITNVRVYDGINFTLSEPKSVLIEGNLLALEAPSVAAFAGETVIDGGGRVLMPGMIDTHVHLSLALPPPALLTQKNWMYIGASSAAAAEAMLMRGFTTVRDAGGAVIGLDEAIDEGVVPGPRIFPAGPFISQTAGHGDLRLPVEGHHYIHNDVRASFAQREYSILADGADEVLRAAREVLHKGATQVKVHAGGGGATPDPLHTIQYTVEELAAAVQAAEDYGTYVMAHLYRDESIRRALEAGIKSLEHGTLMSEEAAQLIKEAGVYLVPQVRLFEVQSEADRLQFEAMGPTVLASVLQLADGLGRQLELIKEYELTIGFGTDQFGSMADMAKQSEEFAARAAHFTPEEILDQLYRVNVEILEMSGPLNPYGDGPLGVIAPGAYADLIIVDGNPLEDTSLLGDHESNIRLIMKDGLVYKNTLD